MTLQETAPRIQLCGSLAVTLGGRRVEQALPGNQGRLLFAYLVLNRTRPSTRDELVDAVWPEGTPAASLSPVLSRLRRVLGDGLVTGTSQLRLVLPDESWVDVEVAVKAIHRAESAVALSEWTEAWAPARVALHISSRTFLSGFDATWIEERRRYLRAVRLSALECVAIVGLGLSGPEFAAAERCARKLIELEPYRESGYRLLMESHARRDNVAEALRVYDSLRILLRDELGMAPGESTQALHKELLA